MSNATSSLGNPYIEQITQSFELYMKKSKDYGTSWRIMRSRSLTDQVYIKAKRIRTIEETGENKVGDSIESEFVGILNYSIMALIQIDPANKNLPMELDEPTAHNLYQQHTKKVTEKILSKKHPYGENHPDMLISTYADLTLKKLILIKNLEEDVKNLLVESIKENYYEIIDYAVLALSKIRKV